MLGTVKPLIGDSQDGVERVAVGAELRYAHADGNGDRTPGSAGERGVGHGHPHALGDQAGCFQSDARQQHHKLFSTHAGDAVKRVDGVETLLHESSQNLITGLMAVAVIDQFEVVEVQRQQRERRATLLGPRDLDFDLLDELAPVRRACQRIGRREVFEFVVGALKLLQRGIVFVTSNLQALETHS